MSDTRYFRPKRAVKKMKLAQNLGQTVYLCGVTGLGKTTFVKDYLGRRKYAYYSAADYAGWNLRIPAEGQEAIIVFDDLYLLTSPELREEVYPVLEALMERREVWVILISRCQVPRWLMSLYVNYLFCVIGEEDLLLERAEQDAYFESWEVYPGERVSERIWKEAGGHPLALRILALELLRNGLGSREADVNNQERIYNHAKDYMSNYLETHVYDQWDLELQEFLMELSVVESFDVQMARMITGKKNVEELLEQAMETGDFMVKKDGRYRYKPAFARSMHRRLMRSIKAERIHRIYCNAGYCYEMRGDIARALQAYAACQDEGEISRLLITNARENPANGHYFELRHYYLSLSEDTVRESPVLMSCMSMLQSIRMNAEESERWYGELEAYAANHTGSARKEAKSRLLYLDIGLPHRGTIQMVDILKHAYTLIREHRVVLSEFSVTSNLPSQMNGGKDFCEWSRKDKELAASIGKMVSLVLGNNGKGLVSLGLAESFLEKGMDSYEIVSLAEKGMMQAESVGKTEQCFVAAWLLGQLSLLSGHAEDALERLSGFEKTASQEAVRLLPNIKALRCWILMYQGRMKAVMDWMKEAPDEYQEFWPMERLRYLVKVRVYLANGRYEQAMGLLQKLLYYADKMKRTYVRIEARFLLAAALYHMGWGDWKEHMQACITEAESYHFVRVISREAGLALKLLRAEEFKWTDREYKKQVMEECQRMAGFYPAYLKKHEEGDVAFAPNALKILRMQADGCQTEQIAAVLGITKNTIKYHNKETYKKLGVTSKAAAINEARNRGLL